MTAGFWIGVALGVGGTVVFLIVVASYLFLVTEEEPTRVDWNPTQIGSVDATISNKGWIPAASARGQWLEMQRTKLNRALAETRKALADAIDATVVKEDGGWSFETWSCRCCGVQGWSTSDPMPHESGCPVLRWKRLLKGE